MATRKRIDDRLHAWARPATAIICGARARYPDATDDWRIVTCVPCLCEIVDQVKARVELLMDSKWSGSGKVTRPGQGRKMPREQLEWEK